MSSDRRYCLWRNGKRWWVMHLLVARDPWLLKHGFYQTGFVTRREAAQRLSDAISFDPPPDEYRTS